MRKNIERYWRELRLAMEEMPFAALAQVTEALLACRTRGGTIFIVGNGGSAATASHFACDLAKGTQTTGAEPFRVVALTDNMPLLTAWANDVSYEQVFAQQLAPLMRDGDTLVAISASGTSPNILAAARAAAERGVEVIALTGATGGTLCRLATLTLRAPSPRIEQVEDLHLMVAHSLCVALREQLQREVARRDTHIPQRRDKRVQTPIVDLVPLAHENDASLAL